MPSVNWIECELQTLLSNPWYSTMFIYLNEYRTKSLDRRSKQPATQPYTPASIARLTAKSIIDHRMLIDPVEVGELAGPVQFYRAHDGGSASRTSAGTLGRCWFSRELMENLWTSTKGMPEGQNRRSHFKQLMRACNLVLRDWNAMTQMACMNVPDGCRVAVVAGRGNWRAMMPNGSSRSSGGSKSPLDKNFTRQLSRMAHDPTTQYVIPICNPNWVRPVAEGEPGWPMSA